MGGCRDQLSWQGQGAGGTAGGYGRGWWGILRRVAGQASADRVMAEAAGVTFLALPSGRPALASLVSSPGRSPTLPALPTNSRCRHACRPMVAPASCRIRSEP